MYFVATLIVVLIGAFLVFGARDVPPRTDEEPPRSSIPTMLQGAEDAARTMERGLGNTTESDF